MWLCGMQNGSGLELLWFVSRVESDGVTIWVTNWRLWVHTVHSGHGVPRSYFFLLSWSKLRSNIQKFPASVNGVFMEYNLLGHPVLYIDMSKHRKECVNHHHCGWHFTILKNCLLSSKSWIFQVIWSSSWPKELKEVVEFPWNWPLLTT